MSDSTIVVIHTKYSQQRHFAHLGAAHITFLSANASDRRLLPGCVRIQVPSQLHGVVQYPPDHEQRGLKAVDQKVTLPVDHAIGGVRMPPTQSQMP